MTTAIGALQSSPPKLALGEGNPEALKYGRLWEMPEYRQVSPGDEWVGLFLARVQPHRGAHIIDFGCGTGRAALKLAKLGYKVTMIDFVRNCLDSEVQQAVDAGQLEFIKHDLEQPLPVVAEYGFCADVMEHIPTMRVDRVLTNILKAAQHVFFGICTEDDACGKLIGETLHLTVQRYGWWLGRLASFDTVVHWSIENKRHAIFYVSSWRPAVEVGEQGQLNTTDDDIRANVKHNIAQGYEQLMPHQVSEAECMILGGGPSLNEFVADIKQKRAEGVKLITLNGTYNWAINHGLNPSAQIIVDAREFNKRFTKPVVDGCKYLLASQCHPAVFDGLPKERTFLWQTNPQLIADLMDEQYGAHKWTSIPGGSTVLGRAIPLMRMLGYRQFHLYGCDSCLRGDQHHAYSQPENDGAQVLPCIVTGGRIFWCAPWMIAQASDLLEMIKGFGDHFELAIYGDGLLAHLINEGAKLENETLQNYRV